MGAWRYRVWACHEPDRDMMAIRATRTRKNFGEKGVEYERQYAWYDPGVEGFDWKPMNEMGQVTPFLTITGQEFFTIGQDEGEELMQYLMEYRTDIARVQATRLGEIEF
jgi:hypothetical protein